MDPERKISQHTHLKATEGMVFRYLSLLDKQRELKEEYDGVSEEIKRIRKNNPELRTLIGEIQKIDKRSDDPDGYEKKKAKVASKMEKRKKRKLNEADKVDSDGIVVQQPEVVRDTTTPTKTRGSGSTSKTRLSIAIQKSGSVPVDKKLQTNAEKA